MNPEIQSYARELSWTLEEFCVILNGLTDAQLSWKPDTGEANNACAITTHLVGSTRAYVLGLACGLKVSRDRDAEFSAPCVSSQELISLVTRLSAEIEAALGDLQSSTLGSRSTPPKELRGTGKPEEISHRDALAIALRHAGTHLGELKLTRDLAIALGVGSQRK